MSVSDATAVEEPSPSKPVDYRKSVDQMVNLFGSEKQKRAFSAAKRNVVEEGELDAALATAVSHVKKEVEDVVPGMLVTLLREWFCQFHHSFKLVKFHGENWLGKTFFLFQQF